MCGDGQYAKPVFVCYLNLSSTHGMASDGINRGQCEWVCPQHLKVTEYLRDVSAIFDGTMLPSGR